VQFDKFRSFFRFLAILCSHLLLLLLDPLLLLLLLLGIHEVQLLGGAAQLEGAVLPKAKANRFL